MGIQKNLEIPVTFFLQKLTPIACPLLYTCPPLPFQNEFPISLYNRYTSIYRNYMFAVLYYVTRIIFWGMTIMLSIGVETKSFSNIFFWRTRNNIIIYLIYKNERRTSSSRRSVFITMNKLGSHATNIKFNSTAAYVITRKYNNNS